MFLVMFIAYERTELRRGCVATVGGITTAPEETDEKYLEAPQHGSEDLPDSSF